MSLMPGHGIKRRMEDLITRMKDDEIEEHMRKGLATTLAQTIQDCMHGGPVVALYHGQPWFDTTFNRLVSWSNQENEITMATAIQRLAGMDTLMFSNPLSSRMAASLGTGAWADGNDYACRHFLLAAELISLCVTHGRPKVAEFLLETTQSVQAKKFREQLSRCLSMDRAVQATELRRLSHNACQCILIVEKLTANVENIDVEEECWKHPVLADDSEMYRFKESAKAMVTTKPEEALRLYREASKLLTAAYTEIIDDSNLLHSKKNGALHLINIECCKIWCNIAYLELLLGHADKSLAAALKACGYSKLSYKAQFRRGQALMALERYPEAAEAFTIAHDCPDSSRTETDKNKLRKLIEEARASTSSIVSEPRVVFDRAAAVANTGRFRILLDQIGLMDELAGWLGPEDLGRLEVTSRAFGLEGWLNDLPTLGRRRRIAQMSALFHVATVLAPAAAARQGLGQQQGLGQKQGLGQQQGLSPASAAVASAAMTAVGPWDGTDLALAVSEYHHGQRRNNNDNNDNNNDINDHDQQSSTLDTVIDLVAAILDRITVPPVAPGIPPRTANITGAEAAFIAADPTIKKKKETTLADLLARALMACAKGPPRTVRRFLGACCRHKRLAWQVHRIARTGRWKDAKCVWVDAVLHVPPPPPTTRPHTGQVDVWDKIHLIEHLGNMIDDGIGQYYDEGSLDGTVEDEDFLRVVNQFFAAGIDATMFDMVFDLPPPIPCEEVQEGHTPSHWYLMIHNMLLCKGRRLYQSPINREHINPVFQEFQTVYASIPEFFPGQQMMESEQTPDDLTTYLQLHPAEHQSWILHLNAFKTVLGNIYSLGHLFPLFIQTALFNMAAVGNATFSSVNVFTFALFFSRQCLAEGGPGVLLRRLATERERAMASFFADFLTGLTKMRTIMPKLLLSEEYFEVAARRGY